MIYLINTKNIKSNNIKTPLEVYTLYETNTESIIEGSIDYVYTIVKKYNMEIKNAHFENGKLRIKEWPHSIKHAEFLRKGYKYILLAKLNEDKFKLVEYMKHIQYMNADELKSNIDCDLVVNCSCEKTENGKVYKSVDTYDIKENKEFEAYIEAKYNQFISKSLSVGINMSFNYKIENKEVILTRYTGTSKRVILPNFITSIQQTAFANTNIQEIILNNGLKHIGNSAFENCKLTSVVIPQSVQMMHRRAFIYNSTWLFNPGDIYNTDVVKILNDNVKII